MPGASSYPAGFAQGATIRGLPLTDTQPGEVFWVNNSTKIAKGGIGGSDGNNGTYKKPFSTIDYAIGKCTANRHDRIMVMPGHAETVSAASFITCDVAGVDIIGLGTGADRPTLTWSATASTIVQSAADYRWFNFKFTSSILNVVTGFSVGASGFELHNCEVRDGSATLSFILFITIDTAFGRVKLIGNDMTGIAVTNDSLLQLAGTHDDVVILDNYMAYSAIQTATVPLINSVTKITNFICKRNNFATKSAAGKWIVLAGTANTGVVSHNSFLSDADQTAAEDKAGVDVTGCVNYENYFSSGVDFRAIPTSVYTDEDLT